MAGRRSALHAGRESDQPARVARAPYVGRSGGRGDPLDPGSNASRGAMQVVILAGGLGTRLHPITRLVPKPMVPVAGVPYLAHQLRLLASQSFSHVLMLTGYLGEQIEACFGDGNEFGLRIKYCRERIPMGTG